MTLYSVTMLSLKVIETMLTKAPSIRESFHVPSVTIDLCSTLATRL